MDLELRQQLGQLAGGLVLASAIGGLWYFGHDIPRDPVPAPGQQAEACQVLQRTQKELLSKGLTQSAAQLPVEKACTPDDGSGSLLMVGLGIGAVVGAAVCLARAASGIKINIG